jgi:hypothetical protein
MAIETFAVGQAETGDSIRRLLAKILNIFTGDSPTPEITAIASGTYTTTQSTGLISSGRNRGVMVHVNCTAITGGATVQPQITIPAAGGTTVTAIIGTFSTTGVRSLILYPGATNNPINGAGAPTVLPAQFQVLAVVTPAAGNATFSVTYQLIP